MAPISGSRNARGAFSFGNDSTDFRLAPGIIGSSEYLWATLEAGNIWPQPGKIDIVDRSMAYAGLGLTPTPWLKLALAFNYVRCSRRRHRVAYSIVIVPKG
ncbi:MAG: hypothetical protein ACOY9J_06795 [Pseudomonadota bacterium]